MYIRRTIEGIWRQDDLQAFGDPSNKEVITCISDFFNHVIKFFLKEIKNTLC